MYKNTAMASFAEDSGLVDEIYEASVLPEFWPRVIGSLVSAVDGQDALLSSVRANSVKIISTSERLSETWQDVFERFPGVSNPRTERLLARRHAGFLTDHDVFSEQEIEAHPLYRDVLVPNGYGRGTATAIYFPEGDAVIVNIERSVAAGRFGPAAVSRLDRLRPHLARAAMVSARLSFERARTAVETLAGLGLAACAVGQSGTVVVANGEFEQDAAIWITRGRDRIALHDRRADAQLRDAIQLISTEQGVRSLPIEARDGAPPPVLLVGRVRRAAHDLFAQAVAILVLSKGSDQPTTATPLLQALFDLTPTEAAIAARIAAGQTAEHIALADRKSADTVRGQLKSVLVKTGCRRQADLARLLAQLIPKG
jgi:DNA-binding CsgD family transcriptional regulator